MRVYFRSRFTPTVKVYDSQADTKGAAEAIIRPEVFITDDSDNVMWQIGTPSTNLFPALVVGAFLILLWRIA